MNLLPTCLFLLIACAGAVEPVQLPLEVGTLKMRDGKVYEGAKIIGQDAVGVKVMHTGGTARIAYEKLPKDLAARFPRDNQAAKKLLDDRTVDKALAKEAEEEKVNEAEENSPLEGLPDAQGDNPAKILVLESYISRLASGVADAKAKVTDARARAAGYRQAASTVVTRQDSMGNIYTVDSGNSSKLRKANYHDRRADKQEAKIRQAEHLIASARAKIDLLEKAR
jgi:hypothetical protein